MPYVDLALQAGHDATLHLTVSDDVSGTGDSFTLRTNRLASNGWSGWQAAGSTAPLLAMGRYPDGRLVVFGWPLADGNILVRTETAPGTRSFSATHINNPDPQILEGNGGFLLRRQSDGRYEVFGRTSQRALRILQSAPGGAFPTLVDLDGAASTPVGRLACVGETQGGSPILWGIDADGNLRGAQPGQGGTWAWGRRVDPTHPVGAAWYEGRRGAHELFYTTDRHELRAIRMLDVPLPHPTSLRLPVRGTSLTYGLDEKHLLGHYAGDGRLYLFVVIRQHEQDGIPAVIAETTPGSAWQPDGAGWSPIQTTQMAGPSQRVLRIAAASFGMDGRLACAALMEDRTVRVSTQASLGSTSWSPWATV